MIVIPPTPGMSLVKPVLNLKGELVTKLSIKAPTGDDILREGFPYVQKRCARTGDTIESVDTRSMYGLIAACAGIPLNSVCELEPVDIYEAIAGMRFFFQYRVRAASSETTSAPENGAATSASSSV